MLRHHRIVADRDAALVASAVGGEGDAISARRGDRRAGPRQAQHGASNQRRVADQNGAPPRAVAPPPFRRAPLEMPPVPPPPMPQHPAESSTPPRKVSNSY